MEWKKFDAAHKRAHMRDGKQYSQREKRAQMSRRNRSKQWIHLDNSKNYSDKIS